MTKSVMSCFITLTLAGSVAAQGGVGGKFEVVSVKPCRVSAKAEGKSEVSGGRLKLECYTPEQIIRDAYVYYEDGKPWPPNNKSAFGSHIPQALRFQKITGSRGWIQSDRYTINAKVERPVNAELLRGPMMQAVLEDRFKLKVHRESREYPVYELMVQGTPKLTAAKPGGCMLLDPVAGPPKWTPGSPLPILCGGFGRTAEGTLEVRGVTLDELAKLFTSMVTHRDVIDKTGIAGAYDVQLDLTFNDLQAFRQTVTIEDRDVPAAPTDPTEILSVALRKIGLKLQNGKRTGQFLVIDHIEKPTGN